MGETFRTVIRRHVRNCSRRLSLPFKKSAVTDSFICETVQEPKHSDVFHLTYPYGSRSLSLQIEAIMRLFPNDLDTKALSGLDTHAGIAPSRHQPRAISRRRPYSEDLSDRDDSLRTWTFTNDDHRPSEARGARYLMNPARIPQRVSSLRSTGKVNARLLPPSTTFSSMDSILNEHWNTRHFYVSNAATSVQSRSRVASRLRPYNLPVLAFEERHSSLCRKIDISDLRRASIDAHTPAISLPVTYTETMMRRSHRRSIRRPDLFKPLPPIPSIMENVQPPPQDKDGQNALRRIDNSLKPPFEAEKPPTKSTTATTIYRHYAPAVTHTTIERRVHEIRKEHITRETHTHEYQHRQLPVIDIELLPTRYFIADDKGTIEEIEENQVPPELKPSRQEIIDAAMTQLNSEDTTVAMQVKHVPSEVNVDGNRDDDAISQGRVTTAEDCQQRRYDHVHSPVLRQAFPRAEEKHSVLLLDFRGAYDGIADEVSRLRESSGEDHVKCFL